MVLKVFRIVFFLVIAGSLSIASGAALDTIKGVCSDSVNGMLIDSVTVSAEGVTALSSATGEFTIAVSTTNVEFTAPRYMPALNWHPGNGSFSWNGYKGDVSITVHSLKGNIVSRAVSGKNLSGSTFSLARLPQGVYLVAVETQGRQSFYKISSLKTYQKQSFSLMSPSGFSGSLSKAMATAAAHKLTFTKNNFDTLKITVAAGTSGSVAAKMKSPYPLRNVFKLFTDPSVPDPGPKESPTTPKCANADAIPERIGGQLKKHDFIYIGENHRRICVVINGKLAWHYDTENDWEDDDVWVLSNGNVLHAHMRYIEEVTPKKEQVFRINADGEIHTCQPIGLDKVLYIDSQGPKPKFKIYNKITKTFERDTAIDVGNPTTHTQCRRFRLTGKGTYVAAYMGAKRVVELDKDFKELWSYDEGSWPWSAVALKNGNVICQNEGNLTVELKEGKVVWQLSADEVKAKVSAVAPDIKGIGGAQTCERLSNGNTVIFSRFCDAGIPQAIEVTPEKEVVWILQDWKDLGDSVSAQFLDEPGYPEIPGQTNH